MASFYKRGDYQWETKIRKAGFPQLARTFESKSDAMAWAAEVETEMRRGRTVLLVRGVGLGEVGCRNLNLADT